MNPRHASLILATLLATACSSTGLFEKKIDYKSADAGPKNRLEIPPDLTAPQLNNSYALPGAASVSVQAGLARCGLAIAHRSARPAAMMLLA